MHPHTQNEGPAPRLKCNENHKHAQSTRFSHCFPPCRYIALRATSSSARNARSASRSPSHHRSPAPSSAADVQDDSILATLGDINDSDTILADANTNSGEDQPPIVPLFMRPFMPNVQLEFMANQCGLKSLLPLDGAEARNKVIDAILEVTGATDIKVAYTEVFTQYQRHQPPSAIANTPAQAGQFRDVEEIVKSKSSSSSPSSQRSRRSRSPRRSHRLL